MNWNRFQEHTGRRWHALHGNFTPCGSRRLPSLPATAHGPWGRFNARTETGQSYLPDIRVIASRPATACLCADGCSPYTSFLKAGSWPAHSHTAFLSDAYRTYPMDLFNYRTVASPHRRTRHSAPVPIGGGVESPLNWRGLLAARLGGPAWPNKIHATLKERNPIISFNSRRAFKVSSTTV